MVQSCRGLLHILAATALALSPLALGARPHSSPQRQCKRQELFLLQHRTSTTRKLSVAYAAILPYGALNSSTWRDGLAVLAHSLQRVAEQSAHRSALLALLPDSLPRQEEERQVLAQLGLEAHFVPVPVPLEQVKTDFARKELSLVLGEMEQLKYYGAALTEYDRVVILDGDTMFLTPIDELFLSTPGIRLQGIYDHELDINSSTFPPLNSGFLVYTPDTRDFDTLNSVVREGDFRSGTGWEGSNTGWTYGTGSQGVLSFYYNQVQPGVEGFNPTPPKKGKDLPGLPFTVQPNTSRFLPLDRSVYNVIDTDLLEEAVRANRTNASRVKVFHFTGKCSKPWLCFPAREGICEEMTSRWWSLRAELAKKWGGDAERCQGGGEYMALPVPAGKGE